ncbi:MAG: peptidylprolyl isomerase [Pseudomonadota bacterium]
MKTILSRAAVFLTLLFMVGQAGVAASAQMMGDAVIATVNDKPISTFDVQQRMRLMMATSGSQIPPEAEAQYQRQALRDLIEEELKRQEAARFDVSISDEQVVQELARIAGGDVDGLARQLAQAGIAIETLREKIRAETAWDTLVRGRYRSRVSITEGEIDDMLDEMRAEKQAEQYLLSEICLPISDPAQRQQVYGIGMQMLQQMQQGVPFQALAQRFSVCPSAARGGDLGWMRMPELDNEVGTIVSQLSEGNVSTPVETQEGDMLKLVALRSRRAAAEKGDPSYELAYASVRKGLYSRAETEATLGRLPLTNPCEGDGLSTDLGEGVGVTLFPMLPINQIRGSFHNAIIDLERGDLSGLLESTDYYHRVFVCEMDEGLGLPRRRMVENRLEAQQFDLLSRRYLRDVERDSTVYVRSGDNQNGEPQDS